jgi:peroxiredoxin
MTLTQILLFITSLFLTTASAQNALYKPHHSKEINFTTYQELRKSDSKIKIKSVFNDGTILNKQKYDSLVATAELSKFQPTIFQDTVSNDVVFVYKKPPKEDVKKIEDDFKRKNKDDKEIRKNLNGTRISNLELKDLNGTVYTLESLKGKVIVLNFWFTQCKPCVAEFPDLNQLKVKFDPEKVVFFAVSWDDTATINTFMKNRQLDYTIIPKGNNVIDYFKIRHYPYNVIIDQNGTIEYIDDVLSLNIFKKMERKIKSLL